MASGRVPKMKRELTMTESDTALGQVVGGEFEGNFIASQNAYAVAAEPACQVRKHEAFMFELHAEFPAGEFLDDRALYFYAVFFTHSYSCFDYRCGAGPSGLVDTQNRLRTGN
jgi:hypothetical protein